MENIAGIVNEQGNVLGLMPHPERASDPHLGHTDGQKIFRSIINDFVSRTTGESVELTGDVHYSAGGGRREHHG